MLGASGPSPPERNVQPLRRKSHMPASIASGFFGSIVTDEQPVDALLPLSTSDHDLPPSLVRYRPRSFESDHSLPTTQANTTLPFFGCTRMRTMRSEFGSPMLVHVSPSSVDL